MLLFNLCLFIYCSVFKGRYWNSGLPSGSVGKESACNAGNTWGAGLIPGFGRTPGGWNDNPLQYSCLQNPMDRGAWRATYSPLVAKGWTRLTHSVICNTKNTWQMRTELKVMELMVFCWATERFLNLSIIDILVGVVTLCSRTVLCILVCLATFLDSASYLSVVTPRLPLRCDS